MLTVIPGKVTYKNINSNKAVVTSLLLNRELNGQGPERCFLTHYTLNNFRSLTTSVNSKGNTSLAKKRHLQWKCRHLS